MNDSTKAKFAALYAAAQTGKQVATKATEAPKVATPQTPVLLSTLAAKPTHAAPQSKLQLFKLTGSESSGKMDGYTATTWESADLIMQSLYSEAPKNGGYMKAFIEIKWENGYFTTQKIYVSPKDYCPHLNTIATYLRAKMYGTNPTISFDDEAGTPELKPIPPTPAATTEARPTQITDRYPVELLDEYTQSVYNRFPVGSRVRYMSATRSAIVLEHRPSQSMPVAKVKWEDTGKESPAFLDEMEEAPEPATKKNFCTPMQFEFFAPTVSVTPTEKKALTIEKYSDKSFVVRGEDTKKFKDELYNFGGSFNSWLKGGSGWIFSNKHLPALERFIK